MLAEKLLSTRIYGSFQEVEKRRKWNDVICYLKFKYYKFKRQTIYGQSKGNRISYDALQVIIIVENIS